MNVVDVLTRLLGRDPTQDEINKLHVIKNEFNMADSDPAWSIILAFGHYEMLYAAIPEEIRKASIAAQEEHRIRLEATASTIQKMTEKSMVEQVATTVDKLSERSLQVLERQLHVRLRNNMAISVAIASVLALLCLTIAFYIGFSAGSKTENKVTKKFSEINNISELINCSDKRFTKTGTDKCQGEWRIK